MAWGDYVASGRPHVLRGSDSSKVEPSNLSVMNDRFEKRTVLQTLHISQFAASEWLAKRSDYLDISKGAEDIKIKI